MGVIIRQSSWALVANYIGVILGFVNVMLIMPAVLEPSQIGLINLILSSALLVFPLMDLSATALLNRYFTDVKSPQLMLNFSLVIMVGGAVLFFILFLFGKPLFVNYYSEKSPDIISYYWIIYVLAIVLTFQYMLENYSNIHKSLHISIFIKEVLFRLMITCFIGFLYFGIIGFPEYVKLHLGSYFFATILLLLYLFIVNKLTLKLSLPPVNKYQLSDMFRFGSYMLFTGMTGMFAIKIDSIMLGSLKGLNEVGIYSLAMFMVALIDIPRRMVVQSSFPILRQAMHDSDMENIANIQQKAILNLIIVSGCVLMILLINMNDIYRIIPNGHLYREGTWVVAFLGLARLAEMMNGVNNEIFQASKHYKYVALFFFIMAITAIGFNILLIPAYGAAGAALATLLASLVVTSIKIGLFHQLFKLKVYSFKLVGIVFAFTLIGVVCYLLPLPLHPVISLAIRTGVAGIMTISFIFTSNISPDLTGLIRSLMKYFYHKM